MTVPLFLHPKELARRWKISPSTLERWRWLGDGPSYIKIGGRIRYRQDSVEAYEAMHDGSILRQHEARARARTPSFTATPRTGLTCSSHISPHGTEILSFYREPDFGRGI